MSTTTYVFAENSEKYLYFSVEKVFLSEAMHVPNYLAGAVIF